MGEDIRISMPSLKQSIDETKKLKTSSNYIIYIEENGRRIKRQDREIIENSKKWRSRPIDCKMASESINVWPPVSA